MSATTIQVLRWRKIRAIVLVAGFHPGACRCTAGVVMAEVVTSPRIGYERVRKLKPSNWLWPGVVAASVTGAAVFFLRGCWHSKMSWPIAERGCSYQVCLGCGIKRLFDERKFRAYGPYRYELDELIVWSASTKAGTHVAPHVRPHAS